MVAADFLRSMPKVELHVHLEGSTRPETLLRLAKKHGKTLPADTVEGLRDWYHFRDFPHFAQIYWACAECFRHPEDIEEITRDFLIGQKEQNILHSEATYTPLTQYRQCGLAFDDQIEAINRARAWGERELGITMSLTIDLPRELCTEEEGLMCADWAISAFGHGVSAFGLGGYEVGFPPEMFVKAFDRAREAGMPSVPHAGETGGPESIWGSLRALGAQRIGHGIRALEDPELVEHLRETQVTLEVCPSSNVRLGVVDSLERHPLPRLIEAGLNVTVNSDDPPMFSTTLTDEWIRCATAFGWDLATVRKLSMNAVESALVSQDRRRALADAMSAAFEEAGVPS
ncbi:MAG: adenosine deaminase [Fimbriimonadales bacterium]